MPSVSGPTSTRLLGLFRAQSANARRTFLTGHTIGWILGPSDATPYRLLACISDVKTRRRNQACSLSHFAMKLLFAAPLSGLRSDPIAFGVHASRLHLAMKLFFAAPTSGLPFFPTALLSHVSCPAAEPIANAITSAAYISIFTLASFGANFRVNES
jgi:hypothetical protein